MWLHSIMEEEITFFNSVLHGAPIPDEFKALMNGEAARAAIAAADAASLLERGSKGQRRGSHEIDFFSSRSFSANWRSSSELKWAPKSKRVYWTAPERKMRELLSICSLFSLP